MFGSCLNRNDYLHKPKMFDNADSWLDRLKRITDYEINKWNSYEETKQDKISVDTSKLTFNNNVLSVKDSFFNSIVETRLANFSSSFFNGAVAELQADIAQEILRLEGRLINDDSFNEYIDSKFIGYEKGSALRQYITQYVTGYTYSTQEINNQLSYKQGQLSWGKGVKVNNDMEVSVNIDNEFSITRYLDIDRFVHINPAGDSDLVDGWDYAKEIDWQREYHENKETQAFTVKNMLRVDYDEDTKTYTLGVPYTNRLVDADYAITSRTILRELRSEYEKKIFVLGDSIQLADIDWFVQKFRDAYEEYINLPTDAIRTAYFRENPDYPNLKTDFDAWYECEFGPTAVDRITDLVSDKYQRAITIAPNGMLDKNADGSDLGENYWRGEHTPYLYTTDGEGHYYTPDKYSFPTTFEVKCKVVELHDRIDNYTARNLVLTNSNYETYYLNLVNQLNNQLGNIITIPNVSSTTAGFAPKGNSVDTQTQITKFLREDGTWATPSYTTDTDTWRNIKVNGVEKFSTSVSSGALDLQQGSNVTIAESSGVVTISATDTTYSLATTSSSGLMPALESQSVSTQDQTTKFLREDGTWSAPSYTNFSAIYLELTGGTMTGDIAMSSNSITGLADPTNAQDAATKNYVDTSIQNLPEPMIFKGSVGSGGTIEWASLPSAAASNKGFTYKVITDNNTAPICKVGDTIISDSTTWVVIPSGDEPSGTVTNVAIQGETNYIEVSGSPITSSGTITISLNTAQKVAWNNKIAGVKVNGTELTADANKKVNVIVPQVYRYV